VFQELASVDLDDRSNDPPPPLQLCETTDFVSNRTRPLHHCLSNQPLAHFASDIPGLFTSVKDVIQQQPSGMVGQEIPPN